jgi:hypothetical protein
MKNFVAKGECGQNHTLQQRMDCKECNKIAMKRKDDKETWNAAIEAAAKVGEKEWRLTEIGNEIRKLKK